MSYEPPGFSRKSIYGHEKVYESSSKVASTLASSEKPALNGIASCTSRPEDGNQRRNYKLLIDPAIKKGYQKIYRFDGEFPGQAPIILRDPRPRRTRIWALTKADLPVPNFKVDKYYVGVPPQREVLFSGLNDNVDKTFLQEMCQKYGNIQNIKIYYDPLTKKHTGRARVTFDLTRSAKLACTSLDHTSVMGNIIKTQLEPNLKALHGHVKPHKSVESSSLKGLDDSTIIHTGKSFLPPSKQFGVYPTPPSSSNSHSPPVDSNASTKQRPPVDPRIKNACPVTPPPPDPPPSHENSRNTLDRFSTSSQLSHPRHGSLFMSTRSLSSANSFEPISPPAVSHVDKTPPPSSSGDTGLKCASVLPPPEKKAVSYMRYEDISPESVFSPVEDSSKKESQNCKTESSSCDESKISKLIERYRRNSGKRTPPREPSRSPKADRYRDDHRSHDSRHHDRDDRRDKHRDRYGDHRSKDYRDDKDYSSRYESKRNDKHADYRSSYRHDSRRDFSDYKSRKGDYGRSDHRDDRGRHSYRDESKYKRSNDRYATSPKRTEERDRYSSSPRRSEAKKKSDFSDVYGKDVRDSYYTKEKHSTRKSPAKEVKEDKLDSNSEKSGTPVPDLTLSDLDLKSDSSYSSENRLQDVECNRVAPRAVSPPKENVSDIISSVVSGIPRSHSKVDLYDEAYTLGVETCSDDEPLPPGDEPSVAHEVQLDRARTKLKVAQDAVRKRKLSASFDEKQDGGVKANKIQIVLKSNQLDIDESEVNSKDLSSSSCHEIRGVWKNIEPGPQVNGPHTPEDNKSTDLPQVEDISPCPSPQAAVTINVIDKTEEQSNLYSDIDAADADMTNDDNNDKGDDDDAMSLSPISSNEDTLEVNAPVKNILPTQKPVVVPPPMFSFPPPQIITIPPPPIPLLFNPRVPPPLIGPVTVPPPPLIPQPSIPPPTMMQTLPPSVLPPIVGLPTRPNVPYTSNYPPQRIGYSGPGFMPNYNRTEQSKAWAWKVQIIEAVSQTIHGELGGILKRDVFRKLVEAAAFKSLEAWWDNQTKPKLTSHIQSATNVQQTSTSSIGQPSNSSASAPGLGPSPFDRTHSMAPGLRASLPKLPTFKRRIQEPPRDEQINNQDQKPGIRLLQLNHIPKKRRRPDSEAESEHDAEVEASSREGERRHRTISKLEEDDDDRSQSPWNLEDSMDAAPAAISVRKSEAQDRRTSTGASLYKTVYSSEEESEEEEESESESESEESEESDEEASEESEYEESEGNEEEEIRKKPSAVKISSVLEDDRDSEASEISVASPRRVGDQELSSELSESKDPDGVPQGRVEAVTLSQTMSYIISDDTSWDSSAQEEKPEPEEKVEEQGEEIAVDEEMKEHSAIKLEDALMKDVNEAGINKEGITSSSKRESSISTENIPSKVLSIDVNKLASAGDGTEQPLFSPGGHSIVSLVELDHSYGLTQREDSPIIDILGLNEEPSTPPNLRPDGQEVFRIKEEPRKPVVPKVLFPPRSFEADDDLVYELLKSGLDYEDAHYLKVGFERLVQVGSESVIGAKWSYHIVTAQPSPIVNTKRRRLRSEVGGRVHMTGSARTEGYYKIDLKEKAKYAEKIQQQGQRDEMAVKDEQKLDASKGKQQSRENRAMQRRLQSAVCNADFGDILKFNKLRVRKKQLRFAKSSIHDWGLFALEPIAADEMVIEYVGEVIRQAIADYREHCYEERGIGSSYMFRLDETTIIDATTMGNLARFINHCCDPNCYAKVIAVENMKKIVIYSKRDIQVDEEITYDYKFPLEDEKIPCLCGAPQCRGTLN